MSLTLSGVWSLSLHLDLFNSVGRYSLTSCFQKWLTICRRFFQDLKLASSWLSNIPGGRVERSLDQKMVWRERHFNFWKVSDNRQWSGVQYSFGLEQIVLNTSSDNLLEPRMINRVRFAVWIKRSQIPPK